MKNKLFLCACALCFPALLAAQDIFQLESFSKEDLNGTARYVGMGGAMNALGADLSVMSSNPAGIGLYRHSDVATSFSFSTQEDAQKFDGKDKTHMNFDQIGFVYTMPVGDGCCRFVNFGFNYHKQKDFNQLINAGLSSANYASQTWEMADLADFWGGPSKATPLTNMGNETYLIGYDATSAKYDWYDASSNTFHKASWGSNQAYDFNISTNLSDQFYLGLTFGVNNIDFNSYQEYGEQLIDANNTKAGNYLLANNFDISGSAFNVKLGFIARPIKESPFRIGIAVSTPTYYNLKMSSYSSIVANYTADAKSPYDYNTKVNDFKYNIHTPWKFNLSLGHIIANCLAIGAEYEYADYSSAKLTYDDGYDYDWGTSNETDDNAINNEASHHLQGVSTFKLGAELMVDPMFSIRAGYNYVTSPFKNRAFANQTINSATIDYASTTDYLTVGGINRWTVGLGFNIDHHFYADAACQYQHQKGHFYPFNTQNGDESVANEAPSAKINLSKTQIMFTLGYRF